MGIPDHLTCLLRNRYVVQEATARTRHVTVDSFQIGKGVHQGCILSPCLFNFYSEYSKMSSWMKHKLESILLGTGMSLSRVRLFAAPWTAAHQAPPSIGFSRQEHWSGCHCLLQGIFPTQGSNPGLPRCRRTL